MTYTFGQVRKALRASGWSKVARSGIVVVAGRDAEPIGHGTLNSILRQSGLKKEDL
ncbi:MAG: type II toxin-antitoxin system HicA family toxin [Bryobacteraceae bacterium]|jgi:predicted RNA binding protein YcfA (HicA-like mRNA interferase family)